MTQNALKEFFDYHENGFLIRKKKIANSQKLGLVKTKIRNEYLAFVFERKWRTLHRAIFLFHHGYLPRLIDHKNQNKLDCRIENLREATPTQNACNRPSHRGTSSKYKGVSFHIRRKKWVANIKINGKQKYLGIFVDEVEAAKAYDSAALKHFGNFSSLNF